jgi:hypothetical protein
MLNPGDYSLCDQSIGAALSASILTPIIELDGIKAATIEAKVSYGSGGTTIKAFVQVTLDAGLTWIDVACFVFGTAGGVKVVNLSGLTPVSTPFTPTDGGMADDTVKDGVLGSAMRVKLTTTGTYVNTLLSVKMSAR